MPGTIFRREEIHVAVDNGARREPLGQAAHLRVVRDEYAQASDLDSQQNARRER